MERNGSFVYESVPGTAVHDFKATADSVEFVVEGIEDSQVTLELEAGQEYMAIVNGKESGTVKTNLGGKLSLSVELNPGESSSVKVTKL